MSDARLDLEVVIDGTSAAAKGLNDVADSSGRIGKLSGGVTADVDKLSNAINGLAKGATAANAAQSAVAQFAAGNFVGALRSATAAVKLLWTAMWSNPLTAILAGLALVASGVVIWANRAKKAAEDAAEAAKKQYQIVRQIAEITGKDAQSIQIRRIQGFANSGNSAKIDEGIKTQQASVDWLEKNALEKTEAAANNKNKSLQKSFDEERDAAIELLQKSQELLDVWKAAKRQIEDANENKKAVAESAKEKIEFTFPSISDEESSDDIRRAALELERKKAIDKESDPIKMIRLRQKFLREDSESESSEVGRIAIADKIYELEKKISAERAKQQEQSEEDAQARADAAKGEADAAKAAAAAKAAERAALNGTERAEAFSAVDAPEGFKISAGRKHRSLASGRATQWFNQRNHDIATASGGTFVTTNMGRPMMETGGEHKGVDRTNALLEQIKERLA